MTGSIDGVIIKLLKTHRDERGFFREILRSTDVLFEPGFGQFSHAISYMGVVKAWHAHKYQTQWTYVATGTLKIVLCDMRKESNTFKERMEFIAGDNMDKFVYSLPPGVVHGYNCINGPADVFYITSGQYDLDDEVRIPHDDSEIGYDWTAGTIIK